MVTKWYQYYIWSLNWSCEFANSADVIFLFGQFSQAHNKSGTVYLCWTVRSSQATTAVRFHWRTSHSFNTPRRRCIRPRSTSTVSVGGWRCTRTAMASCAGTICQCSWSWVRDSPRPLSELWDPEKELKELMRVFRYKRRLSCRRNLHY